MGVFRTEPSDYTDVKVAQGTVLFLRTDAFEHFDETLLGLGSLRQPSRSVDAVCAIFDLAGFTRFSSQVDPHLVVPRFIQLFLRWLFSAIRQYSLAQRLEHGVGLFTRLPFLAKYTGDGVIFLWDCDRADEWSAANVPLLTHNICVAYGEEFLPAARREFADAPNALRVGVARGNVFSIGDGNDFVGPCINIASRVQKVASGISFCVAKRGFDQKRLLTGSNWTKLVLKAVPIRGIGERELVYVPVEEFDSLPSTERAFLQDQ